MLKLLLAADLIGMYNTPKMWCSVDMLRALVLVSCLFATTQAQVEEESEVPLYGQSPAVYPTRKSKK